MMKEHCLAVTQRLPIRFFSLHLLKKSNFYTTNNYIKSGKTTPAKISAQFKKYQTYLR